jgi:catechol-2,3-dioxygenase
MHRRRFLESLSASAAVIAGNYPFGLEVKGEGARLALKRDNSPRIKSLMLVTSVPLSQMKAFYHGLLGLHVIEEKPNSLVIAAGLTRLSFVPSRDEDGKPFYHFAFNIPENKIRAAHKWQKERTALLPIPVRLRDAAFPVDVVDYSHWNAHSIFFFDPAGNVVEFIARHDLQNGAEGPFDSGDILYASEIGLITKNVPELASALTSALGLSVYRGASDQFTALGDENGLLLVMEVGRVLSFDAAQKKAAAVFRTAVTVRGAEGAMYFVPGLPYEITVES